MLRTWRPTLLNRKYFECGGATATAAGAAALAGEADLVRGVSGYAGL